MALQLSVAVREARLNAIETQIAASAVLKIWSGTMPANCAAADTGTLLANMSLPSDWMLNAGSPGAGQKGKSGTWEDLTGEGTATAGYFRIYATGGTVCGLQGTVTTTGGGGDLTLDNTSIATGQPVTITGFVLTDGNA